MDYETLGVFLKYFSRALMLLLVLPVTNCVKGVVAAKLGDDSAEREGRITLNPTAHLDLLGSLAIMLCGFGWSKPLPINPTRMKDYKKGIIIISLTGPLTHFIAAILCKNVSAMLPYIMSKSAAASEKAAMGTFCVMMLLKFLSDINVCLGVINLLPIPPMDGFNILHQFAGPKFNKWYYTNYQIVNRASFIILIVLFYCGDVTKGAFDPLMWLVTQVDMLLGLTTRWIPHVFG